MNSETVAYYFQVPNKWGIQIYRGVKNIPKLINGGVGMWQMALIDYKAIERIKTGCQKA